MQIISGQNLVNENHYSSSLSNEPDNVRIFPETIDNVHISSGQDDFFKKIDNLKMLKTRFIAMTSGESGFLRDPVNGINHIKFFNEGLGLAPHLLQEKYAMMRENIPLFYRMNPSLFHQDVNGPYREASRLLDRPAPVIITVGDINPNNFGTFRNNENEVVWGINDFDQAGKAPVEWDLERFSAGLVACAENNGLSEGRQKEIVEIFADSYFRNIKEIAGDWKKHSACIKKHDAEGCVKDLIRTAEKADQKTLLKEFTDYCGHDRCHFVAGKKIKKPSPEEKAEIIRGLGEYEKHLDKSAHVKVPLRILDIARKLGSGGSSYGLSRYYVLVSAAEKSKKPVILEIKQLLPTTLKEQSPDLSVGSAESAVAGQKALCGYFNPLTGVAPINGYSCMVRELEPQKSSLNLSDLKKIDDFADFARLSGRVLSKAHGHSKKQAEIIDLWVGKDKNKAMENLVKFSGMYANQIRADYNAFIEE